MINPSGIPQFTGDFDQLDKDVSGLRSDAIGIRNGGMDVHSRFQMLGAYYTAPEADDLFATTQPVMDNADTFATKLETVADALDTFSIEARPLAKRLEQLKTDALAFVGSVDGDDDWTEDEDKVHRNKELVDDVTATQLAFQDAERRAASKISTIVGGPTFVADHGSGFYDRNTVRYGYDRDLLEGAKELPWGSVDEQSYEAWSLGWFGHGAKSFVWDGIYHDGIEAGVSGLWTLVGGNGGDAAGDAWGGLKDVVTGIGLYTATPYDAAMDWAFGPDKESADEIRAKKAAKEFGKSLVAWDQWQENPTRAAGTTAFNFLTLGAGPLAVVSKTSEVGAVAKGASVAAKVGEFMDPLSVGLKATGKTVSALPKLSDLTSRLLPATKAGVADAHGVHSVIELEDGSRVLIKDGEFIAYDRHGDVISDTPKQERGVPQEVASEAAPTREPAMADAASHTPLATARAGDNLSPHAAPPGHSSGDRIRNTNEASTGPGASHTSGPSTLRTGAEPGGNGHVRPGSGDHGGIGPDDVGRSSDDALGEGTTEGSRPDGNANDPHTEGRRPSFMHEGPNPYGPRGSLTREQIQEIQVYRANHEPGYLERYYRKNGTRLRLKLHDESGFTPPHLTRPSHDAPWIRAKDAPEPPEPHFLDADYIRVGEDTVTSPARRQILNEAAQNRHFAVQWDHIAEKWKEEAGTAHHVHETADSAAQWGEAKGTYKESHTAMGDATEEFGEKAAEYHYVAENYPDFKKQTLLGPENGNDQFDQVWKHKDGRIVVVEAKSSPGTRLGKRTLPNGRQVSQGSREYFHDIIQLMTDRGEFGLVRDIQKALARGKLEYVVVKGEKNVGTYTGYRYRRFDISRGTLP
ncbi:hypothetical protein ACFY1L_27480 [Streptomyces sp. NPDC001663]|uniref:hypothetical protein n=1 Tax=Streptomyces sp. NPDC001663 TaxID=3364597 RepID=UPI0036ABE36C